MLKIIEAKKEDRDTMMNLLEKYPNKVVDYEENKFINPEERYAWKVRNQYGQEYVKKGLVLAKELQDKELCGGAS